MLPLFITIIVISLSLLSGSSIDARLVDPVCLQGPIPGVSAIACCPDIPNFRDRGILEQCAARVMDDKDSPMDMAYGMTQEDVLFSPGIRCISECILSETNIIIGVDHRNTSERHFDPEATIAAINTEPTGVHDGSCEGRGDAEDNQSGWLPAVQRAVQRCVDIVAQTHFEAVPHDECDVASVFYMACLDTQMFRECPAAVWQSDEYGCDRLRQQAERCPVLSAVLINVE